jgi:hypothetical protein
MRQAVRDDCMDDCKSEELTVKMTVSQRADCTVRKLTETLYGQNSFINIEIKQNNHCENQYARCKNYLFYLLL